MTTSTRTFRPRRFAVIALLVACLGLAACEAPEPTITWFGNENSTNVGPALYCELTQGTDPVCRTVDGPEAELSLRPGDSVQVNIPSEVAEKPWLLIYNYVDDAESFRTPVVSDGETLSYVIRPETGKQLARVELQVLTLTADTATSQPQYTPLQVWALKVNPA